MVKVRIHIVLFLLIGFSSMAYGQWDLPYSRFWSAKNYYNPAFVGEKDHMELSGSYRLNWTGIEDAPKQLYLSAVTPVDFLGMRHTVGLIVSNISMGNERNSYFSGQYNYVMEIGKSKLSAGIEAGMVDINFDESSYFLQSDTTGKERFQIIANPVEKKTFNLNAGISWNTKRFFAGVAAKHINQPRFYYTDKIGSTDGISVDSTYSKIPLTYNFMTGYNINLFNTLFDIQPMFFYQTNGTDVYKSFAVQIAYDEKFSAGGAWKGNDGYALFAGVKLMDIELNYAYDIYQSGIGKESNGSHEISFRYHFPIDFKHRKPQPHKSIRLL